MKKNFLLMLVSLALFAACNNEKKDESADKKTDEQKTDAEKMSNATNEKAERNKKTALASIEAFSAHDVDAILKDATPDGMDYGDGSMKPTKGVDSIKAGIKSWLAAFPDLKGKNFRTVAEGDWVMVWGDWSGTWKGDIMGQKATGKSYKASDVDIFKFNDDGKITEHHSVQSPITIAVQVGMKMK